MSTTFKVYKFPYDDNSVLVLDGKTQAGFYVGSTDEPGRITMDDFNREVDTSHWKEDELKLFNVPLFQDVPVGDYIGEFVIDDSKKEDSEESITEDKE